MTFTEKKDQVLLCLYEAGTNKIIEFRQRLEEKGIILELYESYEIGQSLMSEGKIRFYDDLNHPKAKIKGPGIEYVEENLLNYNSGNSDKPTAEEAQQIRENLDELLNRFQKVELGQQIIYDDLSSEIEELKELVSVLSKKNIKQLLTGKLVDAGLGCLTKETLELVVHVFNDQNLLT